MTEVMSPTEAPLFITISGVTRPTKSKAPNWRALKLLMAESIQGRLCMTVLPDTKAREMLTMLTWLLIANILVLCLHYCSSSGVKFWTSPTPLPPQKKEFGSKTQKRSQLATATIHREKLQKSHNLVNSNKINMLFNLNIETLLWFWVTSEALLQLDKNLHKV